ncbi:hypothetical protein ACJX0J_033638 [Zea mays]
MLEQQHFHIMTNIKFIALWQIIEMIEESDEDLDAIEEKAWIHLLTHSCFPCCPIICLRTLGYRRFNQTFVSTFLGGLVLLTHGGVEMEVNGITELVTSPNTVGPPPAVAPTFSRTTVSLVTSLDENLTLSG